MIDTLRKKVLRYFFRDANFRQKNAPSLSLSLERAKHLHYFLKNLPLSFLATTKPPITPSPKAGENSKGTGVTPIFRVMESSPLVKL